jgi:hypothetical protein
VKLLQPRPNIPKISDSRIVQLTHTVWTQLEKRNEWIYFVPRSDSITILCPEENPTDVLLTGTGKLSIQSGCKGHSLTALLVTQNDIQVNTSRNAGDLLSKIELVFECCESLGVPKNLSHTELDMHFKHIVTHIEDLKYASFFKVSELEKKIKDQEWKHQHTQYHKAYSTFAYIIVSLISIYGVYRQGKFVLRRWLRHRTVKAIIGTTEDLELSTRSSGTGSIVNINIKTSNESLSGNPEALPLQALDSDSTKSGTPELQRSRRSKTTKSYFYAQFKCKMNLILRWEVLYMLYRKMLCTDMLY